MEKTLKNVFIHYNLTFVIVHNLMFTFSIYCFIFKNKHSLRSAMGCIYILVQEQSLYCKYMTQTETGQYQLCHCVYIVNSTP